MRGEGGDLITQVSTRVVIGSYFAPFKMNIRALLQRLWHMSSANSRINMLAILIPIVLFAAFSSKLLSFLLRVDFLMVNYYIVKNYNSDKV